MPRNTQDKLLLKSIYPLIASLFMTIFAFGQSETNNPITYDTTMTETVQGFTFTWNVRITRQKNDKTPRPAIFAMNGTGEVGSDPSLMLTYGPHYWLANGWDGGVKLGNGTHYPILVTIEEPDQNMRPQDLKVVFEALLKALPINKNAVHVAGLSQGSWEWGELIEYSASAGDHTTMSEIKSWVDLEGVGPSPSYTAYNMPYPTAFGYWASHYGGKFFGLEGSTDPRLVWQVSQNMNASVPGSAFFAYENIGGGGHCCWNSMYDPTVTNWTASNPNIVSMPTAPNTPGDYKNGSSIFQWMLRQGDTTLAGTSTTPPPPPPPPPTVSAGGDPTITLPTNSVTLTGTATAAPGTTLSTESWTQTSGPNTATISKPTGSLSTTVSNLVVGTYVFTFTGTSNLGQSTSSSVDVVVNPLTASSGTVPVVSAGSSQTVSASSTTLTGAATAANGTTLSAESWKETSGPNTAAIAKATGSLSTAISGLVAGTYVFTLTTTNNLGQSVSSTVTVVVKAATAASTLPVVNAGSAQSLMATASFLAGTATAASGTKVSSESWKETSGPNTAHINSPTGSLSTPISNLVPGTYVFTFTATNNLGQSASSSVSVTVRAAGSGSTTDVASGSTTSTASGSASTVPTVKMDAAQTITLPTSSVTLTSVSAPATGTSLVAGLWKQTSGPSTATIATATSSSTAVTGLKAGTYVFSYAITNNLKQSATGSTTVTVNAAAAAAAPPKVTVGPAQSITLPTNSATLTSAATPATGTSLAAGVWKQTSGPSTAILGSPASSATAVSGLTAGAYAFSYTITDNLGQSSTGNTTVTVNAPPTPPAPPATPGTTVPVIVATGEYQTFFIDQNKYLWAIGGNLATQGVADQNGIPGTIQRVTFTPANLQIKTAASCLHGGVAVDVSGNVWTWGQGESGEIGNGVIYADQVTVPIKITVDNNGNAFNNVSSVYCYYSMNNARGTYAIKGDGTLWNWGGTYEGMAANGTKGGNVTRPTQIIIPGGRKASQLACGNVLTLLCTDGSVWTCGGGIAGRNPNLGYNAIGNDYLSLHQLDLPSNIVQVAGGNNEFAYALTSEGTLYGWGSYSSYMGGTGGYADNTYFYTPQLLTSRLNLPYPVKSIVTNMVCTHVILTNGTLWGWGDNAEGSVGNGHELNFAKTTNPYSWDFGPAELLQQAPVQISPKTDFVAVYGAGPFVMFDYAEEANGQLWSWGRNKGAVLANGVNGCTASVAAQYPNSWDVTTPTAVDPFTVTKYVLVPSPYCTSNPTGLYCAACLLADALYNPTVVATVSATNVSNALVSATSITTSSAATTTATTGTAGTILSESTPTTEGTGTAAISTTSTSGNAATAETASTDSTSATAAAAATTGVASVSTTTGTLRVQATGSFSVATLDGSQSRAIDSTGTIVGYHWSQASGAQTIIRDSTAATTDVIGLAPGTYAFRLTVTDNQGRSSSAVDSLIIENPGPSGLPGADASNTAGLAAYPTIAHSSVNLVLNSNLNGTVRLNVYSSTGALVQAQEQSKGQTELITNLDISSLASGVYIVQALVGGQTSFTTKFIKQ
jgi:alpha-tubulin suppressor-like RCC1 family protein